MFAWIYYRLILFLGKKSCEVSLSDNIDTTNLSWDANIKCLVFFLFLVSSTDWNQGLFIAAHVCRFVFTSSYRRDVCKVNWHIVKYLLHIVYKSILFWAILLHLILWQSMHFMKAFCLFLLLLQTVDSWCSGRMYL